MYQIDKVFVLFFSIMFHISKWWNTGKLIQLYWKAILQEVTGALKNVQFSSSRNLSLLGGGGIRTPMCLFIMEKKKREQHKY